VLFLVEDMGTLISMLFNLGLDLGLKFKRCKYCNKRFIVWHNRQEHCCNQHRIYYYKERQTQKEFEERQKDRSQYIEYYDAHEQWTVVRSDQLELGSMKTGLEEHRHKNFKKEKELVENQLKALGIKGAS
jgi:hypothetical protein